MEQKSNNQWSKTSIIRSLVGCAGFSVTNKNIKEYLHSWWVNTRHDNKSFRLTETGLNAFKKMDITMYEIEFPEAVHYTSQLVLRLDNLITCPYYLERKKIIVFDENMAIQLVLFSGDVKKYTESKISSRDHD